MLTASVRRARADDLPSLIGLIFEHAEFERAAPPPDDLAARLPPLLFGETPRLFGFVADAGGKLLGYSTASIGVSTWSGSEFLEMNCLYVRAEARNAGVGVQLMIAVRELGVAMGVGELEWQTPDWNEGAIRFYDRTGARRATKQRFTLGLT